MQCLNSKSGAKSEAILARRTGIDAEDAKRCAKISDFPQSAASYSCLIALVLTLEYSWERLKLMKTKGFDR